MALVYAADVMGDDRKMVKKRGDAYSKSDAKDMFGLEDGASLLEDGVIVLDSALPENSDEHRSLSYYELEAQQVRLQQEEADGDNAKMPKQKQGAPASQKQAE